MARFEPPSIQSAFIAGCNLVFAYTINLPSPSCDTTLPFPIKTFPFAVMRSLSNGVDDVAFVSAADI